MVSCQWNRCLTLLVFFSANIWGCATSPPLPQETKVRNLSQEHTNLSHIQVRDLAGVWEYQEKNIAYVLSLDKHGNGTYEWKDGRFITDSVEEGIWRGTWHQQENDREGKFEIRLTQDLRTASGSWSYTRIGQDHDPLAPGGTFTLIRLSIDVNDNGKKNTKQDRHD